MIVLANKHALQCLTKLSQLTLILTLSLINHFVYADTIPTAAATPSVSVSVVPVTPSDTLANTQTIPPANQVPVGTVPQPSAPAAAAHPDLTIESPNDKLSFYFQNIDIRTLLELIAKTSGENFVISDSVKGSTTLNIKNVTWDQALNIVLASHGLQSKNIGDAIFIATTEEMTANESKILQAKQDLASLSPLKSSMINLKYADANVIAKVLKGQEGTLLTARGQVVVNSPTNSVIVRDIPTNIEMIRNYVSKLDKPAKQVSIEARIVNMDATYEAQLGVRFGISNTRSLSGTLTGANELAQGLNPANTALITDRLNFNLPADALSTGAAPASIGLALARLGPILLDLELSALEEEGHTQIISKPRIVTSNQEKARIETGQEIPYQESTSSGATSIEFKKAVLSLDIIPQITPDNKIILRLRATQDTVGAQLLVSAAATNGSTTTPATFGPPTINTQAMESYVLLNNNETVVIGGIYQLTTSNTYDRVPFFSSLPIIGNLFKHRGIKNTKNELLIFITPKIIEMSPPHHQMAYKGD